MSNDTAAKLADKTSFTSLSEALKDHMEPKHILEAELFHIASIMDEESTRMIVSKKMKVLPMLSLLAQKAGPEAMVSLEGELNIMSAASQLPGLVATMAQLGLIDSDRATKNWEIIVQYLDSVMPHEEVTTALSEIMGLKPTENQTSH